MKSSCLIILLQTSPQDLLRALLAPELSPKPRCVDEDSAPGGAPTPKPRGEVLTSGSGTGREAIWAQLFPWFLSHGFFAGNGWSKQHKPMVIWWDLTFGSRKWYHHNIYICIYISIYHHKITKSPNQQKIAIKSPLWYGPPVYDSESPENGDLTIGKIWGSDGIELLWWLWDGDSMSLNHRKWVI